MSMHLTSGSISKVSIRTNVTNYNSIFNFSLIGSNLGYRYDSKAFLFSLVNKPGWGPCKLPQTGEYSSYRYSIYCYETFGPSFGAGPDIRCFNDGSSPSSYSTALGHTYRPPIRGSYGSTSANTFLAGTHFFTPDEVETFYETNKK